MGIGDILKGIGMVIGVTVMHGIDRVNNHNEKVKKLKAKFLRENTSVEKLKAIAKREVVEKGNVFSAEGQAAVAILKERGITSLD